MWIDLVTLQLRATVEEPGLSQGVLCYLLQDNYQVHRLAAWQRKWQTYP